MNRVWGIWYVKDNEKDFYIRFVYGNTFVDAIDNFFEYLESFTPCKIDIFRIEISKMEKANFSICLSEEMREVF